jgi:hypothetical protein
MGSLYCSGPCAAWVNLPLSATPIFLGHSEKTPSIQIRRTYTNSYADDTGPDTPFDKIFSGQSALVTFDLTRFNYGVYTAIADVANTAAGVLAANPGVNLANEIGTSMMLEGLAYPLILVWPYAAKASMGGTGFGNALPPGYRFLSSFLIGPDEFSCGTIPLKIRCTWYCVSAWNPAINNNGFGPGQAKLYDNNTTGAFLID